MFVICLFCFVYFFFSLQFVHACTLCFLICFVLFCCVHWWLCCLVVFFYILFCFVVCLLCCWCVVFLFLFFIFSFELCDTSSDWLWGAYFGCPWLQPNSTFLISTLFCLCSFYFVLFCLFLFFYCLNICNIYLLIDCFVFVLLFLFCIPIVWHKGDPLIHSGPRDSG